MEIELISAVILERFPWNYFIGIHFFMKVECNVLVPEIKIHVGAEKIFQFWKLHGENG